MIARNQENQDMSAAMRPQHERQLDHDMLLLQRAAAVVHRDGQRIDAACAVIAVLFAIGGVIAAVTDTARSAIAIAGVIWFVLAITFIRHLAGKRSLQGANLQEQFDCALFGLPWNSTLTDRSLISPAQVHNFARKLKVGSVRDQRITAGWYDPTDGIHHPYDVLCAQEQNLAWDARLRRRYALGVLVVAVAWTVAGVAIALADDQTRETILTFFVPSLSAYAIAADIIAGQRRVADARERWARIVGQHLDDATPNPPSATSRKKLLKAAREIQDGIYTSRNDVNRVPELVYRAFRTGDEADFAAVTEARRAHLAGNAP